MNRLAGAKSSYLLQHKDNPVDWWEWGAAAFEEAKRRNVPVLLSVGYASCHWCHVMAHESFEDPGTAAVINRDFVAIKADREERPDVDATYMTATQAMTGQGGWPMTCFLDHEGRPFYAGTYFPRTPRGGMPSFAQVLEAVSEAWRRDPAGVTSAAGRIAAQLRDAASRGAGAAADAGTADDGPAGTGMGTRTGIGTRPGIGTAELDHAARLLLAQIDRRHGGFGSAPKFPPAMVIEFLLRHYERTRETALLDAATVTLDHMARGGIYDQLAGGFARYTVDADWYTPHFEKMLDDNALLLRVYAHHARLSGSALSARVADETAEFLLREMRSPTGGFITSLDADSAGVEGLTYRWPIDDLVSALRTALSDAAGTETGTAAGTVTDTRADTGTGLGTAVAAALTTFGVDPARPDPEGEILRRPTDPEDPIGFETVRAALKKIRDTRPQPGRDEIVVLRSNGLAIAALAEAGAALGRIDWIDAADATADTALRLCRVDGGWRHSAFEGAPGAGQATLADHACFAAGLLALYQATGAPERLATATGMLTDMLRLFREPDGAWFDTASTPGGSDGPAIMPPRDPTDGAAPSGIAAAADALLTAAALTGTGAWWDAAEEITASVAGLAVQYPRSAGWHLAVAEARAAGPLQIVIAGPAGSHRDELARAARRLAPGGSVIDVGEPDEPGRPLLADRPGVGGRAAAYVCRGFVCDMPAATPADLERALHENNVIPDTPGPD